MTANLEWTFTGGCILMSVDVTHGDVGASHDELIAAADAMNHAIPTTGDQFSFHSIRPSPTT